MKSNMVCDTAKVNRMSVIIILSLITLVSAENTDFAPEPGQYYRIEKVDGVAAGQSLTYDSEDRNSNSYWVNTQISDGTNTLEKWKITQTQHNGQKCHKIETVTGPNAGRMLVVHSDDRQSGNGRAMVHNAGHNLADECWVIVSVEEQGVSQGYTIMKSQNRHKDKYLIATEPRSFSSNDKFWADVTDNEDANKLWNILPFEGGWSSFSDWTECSEAGCGAGSTRTRTRTCTDPAPLYRGVSCVGQEEEERDCAGCPVCDDLDTSWSAAKTTANFPVNTGEAITVHCAETYINIGARVVTCVSGTAYSTVQQPNCLKPSE
ncbi:hypothetical protein ACHWQZ_G008622 [Mnemiopsis leidyi]